MRRPPLLPLAAGLALPALYRAAIRAVLRRHAATLMAGDPGPISSLYARDAVLEFPGEHTWGPVYRGRAEIEGFLARFLAAGLRGEVRDVLVAGPPWAARVAVVFDDWACDPVSGSKVYENRAVLVLSTRWGRVVRERVYEDTQKVAAFDAVLVAREGRGAGAAVVA